METGLAADCISSAMAEGRSQNNSSTSCVSASTTRKRSFNMLDGDDTNTAAAAPESSTNTDTQVLSYTNRNNDTSTNTTAQALSRAVISDMQAKLDLVEKEKEELNQKLIRRNVEIGDMRVELNKVHNRRIEFEQRCIELTQRNQELEIKVKDLTLKNEYNEWSYMAEDVPASYWIERGFDEDYNSQMHIWLAKMKEYTHQLRKGDPIETLKISNGGLNTNILLLHDDILLPHWKEFADALKQYQKFVYREDYGIERLFIWNIELNREVLDMVAPVLKTTTITKTLSFGGYNFGSEMVSFMADILKVSPYIQGFGLFNSRIDSADDLQRLCKSITDRNSDINAVEARFVQSFDGNSSTMMQIILDASHQLKKLHLKNNGIGTVGTSLIANFLTSNPPLEVLSLENNVLNNDHAILLANALRSNINLKQLYLEDNDNITATAGRQALLQTIFNVSSLNACATSNHTCQIHGLNPDISGINLYEHLSTNRRMKIFTMLSATDEGFFNMNNLGDISYKLIPKVLELSQFFCGETPGLSEAYFEQTGQRSADWNKLDEDTVPITSMFELLRGWAVPSLA